MPLSRRRLIALLSLFTACTAGRTPPERPAGHRPDPWSPAICYACFWDYQPASLKRDLMATLGARHLEDPLEDAQRRMLLARVGEDRAALCAARAAVAELSGRRAARSRERALVVAETLAFTAAECGADPTEDFRSAAAAARAAGQRWKSEVYARIAEGAFTPAFGEAAIVRRPHVPASRGTFILGASKIVVDRGTRVGVQVERTVRDWLSYQIAWDERDRPVTSEALLTWHEGARLRDLLDAVDAKVVPLAGVLVARRGDRWLAPDETGTFRFEVLDDKVQYPTTLAYGDVALLLDTHGLAALVASALRDKDALVVGCGDTEDKMKAAYWLAARGVDAWFPCDRFAGELVGYDAPGVLLGSAPVRREGRSAVIGDRPVTFSTDETIVVEDFTGRGPLRYYDAPARYFRALAAYVPTLRLSFVAVDDAGESSRVVARAEELGAGAIGVRVQTEADAAPVRAWLAGSPSRRAVLLHTAPYAPGYALFAEFPAQTTFGDPRPVFP